jgi:hypothetical protein
MSLAALDALIAGVKVRCEVVERRGRLVAKVFLPNVVDIGVGLCRPAGRWHMGGTDSAPIKTS